MKLVRGRWRRLRRKEECKKKQERPFSKNEDREEKSVRSTFKQSLKTVQNIYIFALFNELIAWSILMLLKNGHLYTPFSFSKKIVPRFMNSKAGTSNFI